MSYRSRSMCRLLRQPQHRRCAVIKVSAEWSAWPAERLPNATATGIASVYVHNPTRPLFRVWRRRAVSYAPPTSPCDRWFHAGGGARLHRGAVLWHVGHRWGTGLCLAVQQRGPAAVACRQPGPGAGRDDAWQQPDRHKKRSRRQPLPVGRHQPACCCNTQLLPARGQCGHRLYCNKRCRQRRDDRLASARGQRASGCACHRLFRQPALRCKRDAAMDLHSWRGWY